MAIPGLVLLLETNVRALKLLQRTLRLADERGDATGSASARAADVGTTALARLEDALAQAGEALEGEAPNDEARELLARARDLRDDIESRLERAEDDARAREAESESGDDGLRDPPGPEVDVEAELQSIKVQVDDDDDSGGDDDGEDSDASEDGDVSGNQT